VKKLQKMFKNPCQARVFVVSLISCEKVCDEARGCRRVRGIFAEYVPIQNGATSQQTDIVFL